MARNSRQIHVVPHGNGWAARRAGSDSVLSNHRTQTAATDASARLARREGGEVVIHRPDGTIRDSDSYGTESSVHDRKH
jgi:hypothetical protein